MVEGSPWVELEENSNLLLLQEDVKRLSQF